MRIEKREVEKNREKKRKVRLARTHTNFRFMKLFSQTIRAIQFYISVQET
jgi:hypothetical protein